MTIAEFINKVGFKVNDKDVDKVNGTISNIKSTATKVLGAIGIGFSLTQINELVESFGRVNNQIKSATEGLGDQREIQKEILKSASETRTSYDNTAKVVSNLVKENKELFGNVGEAVKFNNAATMLFKTAGKTNEEISGLMEAINKSFAKGKVDTETMNQLLERSPEAIELLNRKLGTTSDKLEQMVSDGKITVKDLKDTFVDNADEIQKNFGNVKYTISDALVYIKNKWGYWVTDMDDSLGIANSLGTTLVEAFNVGMQMLNKFRTGLGWLANKLGGTENLLKFVGIAAGAIFAAFKFKDISDGLSSIKNFLTSIKASTLLIVGVIILIALLVEDFIGFMQGKDSLIGRLFEKLGIDADEARETIKNAWSEVKTFLKEAKETVTTVFETARDKVGEFTSAIQTGTEWLKEHETALGLVAIAIGTLTGAIVAYNIAMAIKNAGGIVELAQLAATAIGVGALTVADKAHAIATWASTAATKAFGIASAFLHSKIVIVILIIGALIALGYVVIKNLDKVSAFFKKVGQSIVNGFNSALEWVKKNWQNIILFILNPFAGIFKYLYENFEGFRNFIDGIVQGVKDKAIAIKDNIVDGFTKAIDWIKSLPKQALTWGKDIILSIVEGIKSCINLVGDAASEVAGKIKSFLGFSEPEEGPLSNFHTYMPDMIDLMNEGIRKGKPKVKAALGELTGDMAVLARANVVGTSTASAVTNSNNSTRTVVQNINFTNSFHGERAAQKNTSKIMNKSAKDVTSELARGLCFAR